MTRRKRRLIALAIVAVGVGLFNWQALAMPLQPVGYMFPGPLGVGLVVLGLFLLLYRPRPSA